MEELYRQMYLKYAPGLSQDELNKKVSYAMTQDRDTFVNAFYNKYTGVNPTQQQSNYIKQQDPGFFSQAKSSLAMGLGTFISEPLAAVAEQTVGGIKNLKDQWKKTQVDGFQMEDLAAWNWEELSTEQQLANMRDQQINGVNLGFARLKSSKEIQDEVKALQATQTQYDTSILDDITSGRVGQAGERILLGGLQSWPTYLAMFHPGALAVLGGLHAGKKFNDEFNKNPEEETSLLLLNAAGTGLIEFGGDYIARRAIFSPGFRSFMGGNRSNKAIEAVKELGLGPAGRILRAFGIEGGTEAAQAFAVDIWDSVDKLYGTDIRVGLGNDTEYKRLFGENGGVNPFNGSRKKWHEIIDEGIIGAFMGGNIRVVQEGLSGFNNNAVESRAEILLRTQDDKKFIKDKFDQMQVLQQELANTEDQQVIADLQNKMNDLQAEIVSKQSEARKVIRQMKGRSLSDYANNVDVIRSANEILNKDNVGAETRKINEDKKARAIKANNKIYKDHVEQSLSSNLDVLEAYYEAAGFEQKVVEDPQEYQELYNNSKQGKAQFARDGFYENVKLSNGVNIGGTIYINKEQALKQEAISVGSHELLHSVVKSTLRDSNGVMTKKGEALLKDFYSKMTTSQRRYVDKILNANYKFEADGITEKDFKEYGEEILNIFSDGILLREIKYDEGVLTKLGNLLQGKFLDSGLNKQFRSGEDVYDFMKGYNKRIRSGKLDQELVNMLRSMNQEDGVIQKQITVTGDLLTDIDNLVDTNQTKAEFQNNFPIELTELFSDESDLLDGLILERITGKEVYGKSKEQFVNDVKSDLMLKTYREFDPSKNESFFGWLTGRKNIIQFVAGNVSNRYKKEYAKSLDKTIEGKEGSQMAQDVQDTSLNPEEAMIAKEQEVARVKQEENLRKKLKIEKGGEFYNDILDANEAALSGNVDIDNVEDILSKSFVNRLTDKFTSLMGGGKKYEAFLDEFGETLFAKIPLKELVQLERLIPENERIFTKVVKRNMSPNEIRAHEAKYGNTEALQYESETQGPTLYERLNPTIDQIKSFALPPIKNPKTGKRSGLRGNRKTKIASLGSIQLGFDGTMQVVEGPARRQSAMLEANKKVLQKELVQLKNKIQREPGVQLSMTAGINLLQYQEIVDGINNTGDIFNRSFQGLKNTFKSKYGKWHIPTVNQVINDLFESLELNTDTETPLYFGTQVIGYMRRQGVKASEFEKAHEKIYIDFVNGFNIKGVTTLHLEPTNEKDTETGYEHPDLRLNIKGNTVNIELKGDLLGSQGASINGFIDDNGFIGKNSIYNRDKNIKAIIDAGADYRRRLKVFVETELKKRGYGPEFLEVADKKIPQDIYEDWKAENTVIQASIPGSASLYKKLYTNKKYKGKTVSHIEFTGSGLYSIDGSKKIGNKTVPEFEADVDYLLTMQGNKAGKIKDVTMITLGTRLRSHIKSQPKTKSDVTLLNKNDVAQFSKSFTDVTAALNNNNNITFSKSTTIEESIRKLKNMEKALRMSRRKDAPRKGLSILDFDDTLAQTNSMIGVTMPDGTTSRIDATEFALESANLEAAGAKFDFSEFNEVIDGKKGPFFDKAISLKEKFGTSDIYVLTARPAEAAPAIQKFLKGVGLNIPLKNITGLADGRPEAKAEFIIKKAALGYNDFLFADDAIKNVKAVKTALEILDVKGKVYQARPQFSLSQRFNEVLEESTGFDANESVSNAAAKVQGAVKNKFEFFIPPSAEDFVGLLYYFIGEGKTGEGQMKFLKENLVDPFSRAYRMLNKAQNAIAVDFKQLKEDHADAWASTTQDSGYKGFSWGEAIRVYLWNRAGYDIPGMNENDVDTLVSMVEEYGGLINFANDLEYITRQDAYPEPQQFWTAGSITGDLYDVTQRINRKQYLQEWIDNKNEIFNNDNLNKIEALYGSHYREALEDMLYRMETGSNRKYGQNRLVNEWLNWVNNSVGAIMFFNIRSAMLQTISFANFINWSDNNPLKAAEAFSNQEQFWADFTMIFNSPTLKQRRSGLQTDVNEAELANAVAKGKGTVQSAISYILRKGFAPTQMADSFAISFGGASFYRNRYNTYIQQGLSETQAEKAAMADFFEASEKAQQSARPDMISQQQAGPLGRLILAFQNTPMQYMRLTKKAIEDLKNGRGDVKTNISKIVYYTTVQNIIFSGLQSALFMMMGFSDDEEAIEDKKIRALNTSLDTLLRGSGIAGATVSTIKNMILSFNKESEKGGRADYARTLIEGANISPPIGSKLRKIYNSFISYKYNKDEIANLGFHPDNPGILGVANLISGTTNIPLDRAVMIVNNLRASSNSNNATWQRIATLLGWNTWDVGIERPRYKFKSNSKSKKKTRKKKSR
jgi:hypothetical protein